MPHELKEHQQSRRLDLSPYLIAQQSNPFPETCCYHDEKWTLYNRRCLSEWFDHDEAPKHFPRAALHLGKVTMTIWRSAAGLIHHSFLCPDNTITVEQCCEELHKMFQNLFRIYRPLISRKWVILLHDNARADPFVDVKKKNWLSWDITLDHPPYSSNPSIIDSLFQASRHFPMREVLPWPRRCKKGTRRFRHLQNSRI